MKNPILSLIQIGLAASLAYLPAQALAGEGGSTGVGGGGDAKTEMRIDEIRADILKWIEHGGHHGLKLPTRLTHERYGKAMRSSLMPGAVVVTAVTEAQERETKEEELKVTVSGFAKTCRGFVSTKDSLPHILCQAERFAATGEADQYRLIHHEFAGLAGIERNEGARSDYSVSNQLTDYLAPEIKLRLSITKRSGAFERKYFPQPFHPLQEAIDGLIGTYELLPRTRAEKEPCPSSIEITASHNSLSKAELHLLEIGPQGAEARTFQEGEHETDYAFVKAYPESVYAKEQVSTYLNAKGYLVQETTTFYTSPNPLLRWLSSPSWFRDNRFLKKLSDGKLLYAHTFDQEDEVKDFETRFNCTYRKHAN